MAAPIFYPGYYPGTRPLKKKPGRPGPPPPPDLVMEELGQTINFEMNVPAQVNKNLEADFKGLFNIRYISSMGTGDWARDKGIELEGTDETEFKELPGALGVAFNTLTLKDKGFEAAVTETVTNLSTAILTFKELGTQSEIAHVWDPLLGPDTSTDSAAAMTLNADGFIKNWAGSNDPYDLGRWKTDTTVRDRGGDGRNNADITSVNRVRTSFRDFIASGSSAVVRPGKYRDLQQNMVDSLEVLLVKSPAATGAALDSSYNAAVAQVAGLQALRGEYEKAKAALDAWNKKSAAGNFIPNPFLDNQVRVLEKQYDSALNAFWRDMNRDKNGLAQAIITYADPKILAWARMASFRKDVFEWNELIDNVAEGNIFKNIIWKELTKTRFKYFTPAYLLSNFATFLKDRTFIKYIGKTFKWLLDPLNKFVLQLTSAIARSAAGKIIIGGLAGTLIRDSVAKVITWALTSLGASGVGTLPAIAIAAITYLTEKVWNLGFSLLKGDFEKAYEQIVKEITNLVKVGMIFVLGVGIVGGLMLSAVMTPILATLAGTTGMKGGEGTSGPGGGGGGVTFEEGCFSFQDSSSGTISYTGRDGVTITYSLTSWTEQEKTNFIEAIRVLGTNTGSYMSRLCSGGTINVYRATDAPSWCGNVVNGSTVVFTNTCQYTYSNDQAYLNYLFAHETGHLYAHRHGYSSFIKDVYDTSEHYMPTYLSRCVVVSSVEDYAETVGNYIDLIDDGQLLPAAKGCRRPYNMQTQAPLHYNFAVNWFFR